MKLLVANRGEIAVRIMRACRELGIRTVAVFSECDRTALHTRLADEAHYLGPSPAAESYLRIDALVDVAARCGATLVHPGYGFLAENAEFAQACLDAGLTFVGPDPEAIRRMGDKSTARSVAAAAGVPVVPGSLAPVPDGLPEPALVEAAAEVGYPLLVKAVAGGGGKGMRVVARQADLVPAVRAARSEAASAFGDGAVYFERRLESPRHVEVQLLGDGRGTVLPFVERDCSIQRRHQKVVEESPSPVVNSDQRRALADAAVRIARAAGYTSAGTVEFLVDQATGAFHFLEMNTRLQVEHPVTEVVTGVDLVTWQIRLALGEPLALSADRTLTPRAHAIECRIYAEDPDRGFLPSPGLIRALEVPGGPNVRDDRGVSPGFDIPVFYDAMIAKLIVWDDTRMGAMARLRRALDEYRVVGVQTTVPFFQWLVGQPDFLEGRFGTTYLDDVLAARQGRPFVEASEADETDAVVATALAEWFRARRALGDAAAPASSAWRRASRVDGLR